MLCGTCKSLQSFVLLFPRDKQQLEEYEEMHSLFICFAERSQDSTGAVLSDSSSTQDMFNEPASSQDSLKKTYTDKRISAPCADTLVLSKETLGPAEEKGMPDLTDHSAAIVS